MTARYDKVQLMVPGGTMIPWTTRATSVCLDCGTLVINEGVHDRFHDILNDHAAAIAVLLNSHRSAVAHDRYDAPERVAKRAIGNNWSTEAFSEVAGPPGAQS